MHIAVASDHAGFPLKEKIREYLGGLGHTVEDLGTCGTAPVDYPDFAEAAAAAILSKRVERAVLICGSGVGPSVAVNKFPGIRAGLCHDTYSAHQILAIQMPQKQGRMQRRSRGKAATD